MISWIILIIAIMFEIAGSVCLKLSHGFTKTVPSVLLFIFYATGIMLANFAIKKIDISVAYTIWAGIGTAAVAVIGIVYFKEPSSLIKILSIVLIILGVIGLNFSSNSST